MQGRRKDHGALTRIKDLWFLLDVVLLHILDPIGPFLPLLALLRVLTSGINVTIPRRHKVPHNVFDKSSNLQRDSLRQSRPLLPKDPDRPKVLWRHCLCKGICRLKELGRGSDHLSPQQPVRRHIVASTAHEGRVERLVRVPDRLGAASGGQDTGGSLAKGPAHVGSAFPPLPLLHCLE